MTDWPKWYACLTGPRAEQEASVNLKRAGYWVFYPFPRYVFFALRNEDENFHVVRDAKGVSCIVKSSFTKQALQIPNRIMTRIMDWAEEDGRCPMEAAPHWFRGKVGDAVEYTDGPFQGLVARIASISRLDDDEVSIWVSMLGHEVEKPVPLSTVKLLEVSALV
jgi:transcription antitermination factor NusG